MKKGEIRKIKLTNGKYVIVDSEDYEMLSKFNWGCTSSKYTSYARTSLRVNGKYKTVYIHAMLLDCPKGMQIDHINRNGLDNRKKNIRVVTRSENLQNIGMKSSNTSGFTGVTYLKKDDSWIARKQINKKKYYIGWSKDRSKAIRMYKKFISTATFTEPIKL